MSQPAGTIPIWITSRRARGSADQEESTLSLLSRLVARFVAVRTEGGLRARTVYRRGETWTYVVDIGHDATGRRRQTSKGRFSTKKEAQGALNVAVNSLQQGTYV